MDVSMVTVITVIILIILCVLPIVLINRSSKNKAAKSLSALKKLAAENQANISEYEIFNNIAIGIDKESRQLFFIRNAKEQIRQQIIGLADFKKCRITEAGHTAGTVRVIEKLDLAFTPVMPNQKEVTVNIYNTDDDNLTLSGEIQFGEKWADQINQVLAVRK
ncbi:MAG: hypothetical protein AAGU19_15835 [Prolixibacteraceae bacterium]